MKPCKIKDSLHQLSFPSVGGGSKTLKQKNKLAMEQQKTTKEELTIQSDSEVSCRKASGFSFPLTQHFSRSS